MVKMTVGRSQDFIVIKYNKIGYNTFVVKKKLLLTVYFFLLSLLFLHSINAGDFFHHLNTGRHVVTHFSLPYLDDLSFTAYGKPWAAYAWASGVIFYLVYSLAGTLGISILFAFFGLLCALFLYLLLGKLHISLNVKLTVVFLASSLISLRWPTRPEVLGPTFVIGLLYLLLHFQKTYIFLPVFFWFWGILYGSSTFLGIIIFALFLIIPAVFKNQPLLERVGFKKAIVTLSLSLVASLLNGYGLKSFLYILQIPAIAPHVGEWLPLHLTMNRDLPELVLFYQHTVLFYGLFTAITVLTIIIAFIKKRPLVISHVFFLCLALAVLAPFYTSRFINVSPLTVSPIIAIIIHHIKGTFKLIILVILLFLASALSLDLLHELSFDTKLESTIFPVRATNFLKTNNINGNIFSLQEFGAFISWQLPHSKVFVDTRDDLYQSSGVFEDLKLLAEEKIDIIALLSKYKSTIVIADLANAQSYSPLIYDDNWSLVLLTEGYFISLRKDLAIKHKVKILDALDPSRIPPVKPGELTKAEEQLQFLLDYDPSSIENKVRMIEVLLAKKDFESAVKLIEELDLSGRFGSRQVVVDMESALLLGKVYLAANQCNKARIYLMSAEKLSFGQLLFYPTVRLPTNVDRYFGDYYLICEKNKAKAHEYFTKSLQNTSNPVEKRQIEQKLELLHNE